MMLHVGFQWFDGSQFASSRRYEHQWKQRHNQWPLTRAESWGSDWFCYLTKHQSLTWFHTGVENSFSWWWPSRTWSFFTSQESNFRQLWFDSRWTVILGTVCFYAQYPATRLYVDTQATDLVPETTKLTRSTYSSHSLNDQHSENTSRRNHSNCQI